MTERAQTACCHASEVEYKSEAPKQSEDRGVVRGDHARAVWIRHALLKWIHFGTRLSVS